MKKFILRGFQLVNLLGLVILFISSVLIRQHLGVVEEPNSTYLFLFLFGLLIIFISHILLIPLPNLAGYQDEIEELLKKEQEKISKKEEELDKLLEFLKNKALRSTVVTKEEIYEHMNWKEK